MCQQLSPYCVRITLAANGERLPVLLSRADGIPIFDPTVWAISELRGRQVASNTILQALRSLIFLYLALDRQKIDLKQRLAEGQLLTSGEIEEIVRICKSTLAAILEPPNKIKPHQKKILSLERVRMAMTRRKVASDVDPNTAAIRLG
jgi:hypothetical protein